MPTGEATQKQMTLKNMITDNSEYSRTVVRPKVGGVDLPEAGSSEPVETMTTMNRNGNSEKDSKLTKDVLATVDEKMLARHDIGFTKIEHESAPSSNSSGMRIKL